MKPSATLKASLERLTAQYDHTYLPTDPVSLVHRYVSPADRETAGLAVSLIAYGGASQIIAGGQRMLARVGPSPAAFARALTLAQAHEVFADFKHRWTDGNAIAGLWLAMGDIIRVHGSLGNLIRTIDDPGEPTIEGIMTRFAAELNSRMARFQPFSADATPLIPAPVHGSACKRPAMYFRWMVRGPDGIDLGVWQFISSSRLIIPLDRHIARMARRLKLTARKTDGWRTALDITASLRKLDPEDPLRYDFALVRPGITGGCPPRGDGCAACVLNGICEPSI